jgi:hypothetical protein
MTAKVFRIVLLSTMATGYSLVAGCGGTVPLGAVCPNTDDCASATTSSQAASTSTGSAFAGTTDACVPPATTATLIGASGLATLYCCAPPYNGVVLCTASGQETSVSSSFASGSNGVLGGETVGSSTTTYGGFAGTSSASSSSSSFPGDGDSGSGASVLWTAPLLTGGATVACSLDADSTCDCHGTVPSTATTQYDLSCSNSTSACVCTENGNQKSGTVVHDVMACPVPSDPPSTTFLLGVWQTLCGFPVE